MPAAGSAPESRPALERSVARGPGKLAAFFGRRLWRATASWVRKGFDPPPLRPLSPRWWSARCSDDESPAALEQVPRDALPSHLDRFVGGVGFVLPTALRRSRSGLRDRLAALGEQIADVHRATSLPVVLIVGLQWFEGEEAEALALLEQALEPGLRDAGSGCRDDEPVTVLGLTLQGPGKVETLRTCLPLVAELDLRGMGWIDDDIRLEPQCLAHLVEGFLARAGGPRVVGAAKVPHQRESTGSRWLYSLKQRMDPAINYPHGCCMMVDASLLDRGIPERYCCDDGYFCYEMLRRVPDQVAERLALVPDAVCHYGVGADRGRLLPRLRRLLLNHIIFLADYPPEIGARYLGDYLYPGFWPISTVPTAGGRRSDPVRWALQAFHLTCLATLVVELAIRGLLRRPLREIRWSS